MNVTGYFNVTALERGPFYAGAVRELCLRKQYRVLRAWVPSCGTGEAAYALALVLADDSAGACPPERFQVFASDVDPQALRTARVGRYPKAALAGLSLVCRERFFVEEDEEARIAFTLRRSVLFSCHDFWRDSPLSRIDLLDCRMALMRCPVESRRLAMVRAHFALRDGGLLIAGPDAKTVIPGDLFVALDPDNGLYQAKLGTRSDYTAGEQEKRSARHVSHDEVNARSDELRGVNAQRFQEIDALDRVHADLQNFFVASEVLAFICNRELRITNASKALSAAFGLERFGASSLLLDIARFLPGGEELVTVARAVQASEKPREWMDRLGDGSARTFLIRVLPYRTKKGELDGIVAVFTEVTALEEARSLAWRRERQQAAVAELGLAALSAPADSPAGGLYQRALDVLVTVFGFARAAIFSCTHDAKTLVLSAAYGFMTDRLETRLFVAAEGGLLHWGLSADGLVQLREPRLERNWSLVMEEGEASRIAEVVACPLRAGETLYGVLMLFAEANPGYPTEDLPFVQSIVNVLTDAIARQRSRCRLSLEHSVSVAVARANDIASMAGGVREALASELAAGEMELWVAEGPEHQLKRVWPKLSVSGGPLLVPDDPVANVFRAGSAIARTTLADGALRGELVFPVTLGGSNRGVVRCVSREPIPVDADLLAGLAGVGRTIGEFLHWKRIDDALRESEQRFRAQSAELEAIYATLPVGLSIYDRQLNLLKINSRLAELRQSTRGDASLEESMLRQVVESGEPLRDVELTTDSETGLRSWLCSFAPVLDPEGRVAAVSSVVQDITEQKRVEQALREADRQKDDFLAMLGHELRNPLGAIRNATELLVLLGSEDDEFAHVRGVLDRQTRQMAKLIDGLLDVSRIVRGKLALDRESVDLCRLLRDVVQDHIALLEQRRLFLELDLPEHPVWVNGDRVRLAQVFDNILSNAAKFTPREGHIAISVQCNEQHVRVRVADDGVGIEPDLLPHIFEPFRQAQQSLDRATGGLGLGLALVRGLIELHGGTVSVVSEGSGLGSTFCVELAVVDRSDRASTQPPARGDSLRVLVVEDNIDMAETMAELLRMIGHEVVALAGTGREGVARALALHPDVVLCDFGLPGDLDGLDVARAIRAELKQGLRLIAVTGYGGADSKRRAREAGFDACLIKPVSLEQLQKHLQRIGASLQASSHGLVNPTGSG